MSNAIPAIIDRLKSGIVGLTGVYNAPVPSGKEQNSITFTTVGSSDLDGRTYNDVDTTCNDEDSIILFQALNKNELDSKALGQSAYKLLSRWQDQSVGIEYTDGTERPITVLDSESEFYITTFQVQFKFKEVI